jgi:hypothetical protein
MTDQTTSSETAASWWEDYLEIFFAPSKVFARRQDASFWLPLLILTVVAALLVIGLRGSYAPVLDADLARGMEAAQQKNDLTAEQVEQGIAIQQKVVGVVSLVIFPILALLLGLILWGTGKLVGATEKLGQAMVGNRAAAMQGVLPIASTLGYREVSGLDAVSYRQEFVPPDVTATRLRELASRYFAPDRWITISLGPPSP